MTSASIYRKSAASLARLIPRVPRFQRNYSAPVPAALNRSVSGFNKFANDVKVRKMSTDDGLVKDEFLLRSIQSNIQLYKETENKASVGLFGSFPFEIIDHPEHPSVTTFTRDYNGETINVEVRIPNMKSDDPKFEPNNINEWKAGSFPFTLTTSKKGERALQFVCKAFSDKITIQSVKFNTDVQGYHCHFELDFLEGLLKYMDARGINPSNTGSMFKYMYKKECRNFTLWLKKLQEYVEA